MKVSFVPLLWEDYPSINTPINAENLNRLEAGVAGLYEDMVEINVKLNGAFSEYVTDWLDEHVTPVGSAVIVDDTLTVQGAAADAKKTGDEISELKEEIAHITSSAMPTAVRQAIKTLFETGGYADTGLTDEMAIISSWASQVTGITLNQSSISITGSSTSQLVATTTPSGGTVTWSSSDTSVATVSSNGLVTGVGNGTAIITATSGDVSATCTATVSGFKSLVSISAVYTQSGTVYDTDSLDDLKADLVVTGLYDDQSTETITDYTLSGTLEVGTSTIVVSYRGKTTTFNVTVTEKQLIHVTYTQGSIGAGTTGSNRVSGVIIDGLHMDGESYRLRLPDGYSIYPYKMFVSSDSSIAGTMQSNNVLYGYVVSDSGYVCLRNLEVKATLNADNYNMIGPYASAWLDNEIILSCTKTGQYGYTVTGIGFVVRKNDDSDITPNEIRSIITLEEITS